MSDFCVVFVRLLLVSIGLWGCVSLIGALYLWAKNRLPFWGVVFWCVVTCAAFAGGWTL